MIKSYFIELDSEEDDDDRVGSRRLSNCFKGLPGRSLIILDGENGGSSSQYFDQIESYITEVGVKVDSVTNSDPDHGKYPNDRGYGNSYDIYTVGNSNCFIGFIDSGELSDRFVCASKSIIAKALEINTSDIEVDLDEEY